MRQSKIWIDALKRELRTQRMSYAQLALALHMSESSIKRILAQGDMSLSRLESICAVLKLDLADLAQRAKDMGPTLSELTLAQEQAVVADARVLLVAICVLSQWTLEQITASYAMDEAECVRHLIALDRIGLITLHPNNRYQLQIAKTFRWQPHGPVMQFFREHAVLEYFGGSFAGETEGLYLVHGSITHVAAMDILERLQRIGQEFARQHQSDQRRPDHQKEGYTLVLAMRHWEFSAFSQLRRNTPNRSQTASD